MPAAIDDVIARAFYRDWAELRGAFRIGGGVGEHSPISRAIRTAAYALRGHSGCTMSKPTALLPDRELVLSSTARLQTIVPAECSMHAPNWRHWDSVQAARAHISTVIFDRVCDLQVNRLDGSVKM